MHVHFFLFDLTIVLSTSSSWHLGNTRITQKEAALTNEPAWTETVLLPIQAQRLKGGDAALYVTRCYLLTLAEDIRTCALALF